VRQGEEGSLEGVLGIVFVVQDPAAHTQHAQAVALDE
jgi:hypothetical protein